MKSVTTLFSIVERFIISSLFHPPWTVKIQWVQLPEQNIKDSTLNHDYRDLCSMWQNIYIVSDSEASPAMLADIHIDYKNILNLRV